jgi:glycosyltransferase involved in cell wall biosynthesis
MAAGQRENLERASCFHVTAQSEYLDVRKQGFRQPVAIIPIGIDFPVARDLPSTNQRRRLIFVGRIHPKKGVDMLLAAWKRIENSSADWELRIVGPDQEEYAQQMKEYAKGHGLHRVFFDGPAYGHDLDEVYNQAGLFVLPTHSENFAITVTEALAHGVPCIVSKGAPWSGLIEHGCGWRIDIGADPLVHCLREAMALPRKDLRAIGTNGRTWMERDLSWDRVGRMMKETYEWVVGGGSAPEWVECS